MQVRPKLGEIAKLTQSEFRTESEFHAVNLKQPICYAQFCLKKRAANPKKLKNKPIKMQDLRFFFVFLSFLGDKWKRNTHVYKTLES